MKHPSEFIPSLFTDRLCDLHCPLSSAFIPRSEFRLLVPFIPCRNMIDRTRLRWNSDLKAAFLTSVTALCASMSGMGRGEQCLPSHSGRGPSALSSCSVLPRPSDQPPTPMSISTFQGHFVQPLKVPQLIWVPLQQFFLYLYNQWYFCALVWALRNSKSTGLSLLVLVKVVHDAVPADSCWDLGSTVQDVMVSCSNAKPLGLTEYSYPIHSIF